MDIFQEWIEHERNPHHPYVQQTRGSALGFDLIHLLMCMRRGMLRE